MTSSPSESRFDELCAGLALGDWGIVADQDAEAYHGKNPPVADLTLELIAAELEIQGIGDEIEQPSARLLRRLYDQAAEQAPPAPVVSPAHFSWRRSLGHPVIGWAAAAAIAIIAMIEFPKNSAPTSPSDGLAVLRQQAPDLLERNFSGLGDFAQVAGNVVWSDQLQQGYMILKDIPANDPTVAQYQLWIVDPKRDEAPVDGGVFDVPKNGNSVVVPISAKLALTQPQAFVITLEQPGGVVKSKQERVVALAKS